MVLTSKMHRIRGNWGPGTLSQPHSGLEAELSLQLDSIYCPSTPPTLTTLVTKSLGKLIHPSANLGEVTGSNKGEGFGET